MALLLFNPENDLALADNGANYMPPPRARRIAEDLSLLPLWYGTADDLVGITIAPPAHFFGPLPAAITPQRVVSTLAAQTEIEPWGWSLQMRARLARAGVTTEYLPSLEEISRHRELSHRASTIPLLQTLQDVGLLHPHIALPRLLHSCREVEEIVDREPALLFKAGWSGSGKGLYRSRGEYEIPLERWTRGVIQRQGSIIAERLYEKEIDFAVELRAESDGVHFVGYSLFETDSKGSYVGNRLMSDAAIEKHLSAYIDIHQLHTTVELLCQLLAQHPLPLQRGYIGIDMMVIRTPDQTRTLHPCVEVNRRTNMGIVAHRLTQEYLSEGKQGCFGIDYFATNEALMADDQRRGEQFPLHIKGDKIEAGYLSLCPLTPLSRYRARLEVW